MPHSEVKVDAFGRLRPLLYSIAYKMTCSVEDSEDILQDVLEKWLSVESTVENGKAYLAKAVANSAITYLQKRRKEKELYFGLWLPTPTASDTPEPDHARDQELKYSFLLLLEKMSPLERAVYLLRESFEMPYSKLAENFEITPEHGRQLYHRAKARLAGRPRFYTESEHQEKILSVFEEACMSGNLSGLIAHLKEDIILYSDGGGKVPAAVNNIRGKESATKFLKGIYNKNGVRAIFRFTYLNSSPAAVVFINGAPDTIAILETDAAGIREMYFVRNPDKIRHLQHLL